MKVSVEITSAVISKKDGRGYINTLEEIDDIFYKKGLVVCKPELIEKVNSENLTSLVVESSLLNY